MQNRVLGNSGLSVGAIAFGCWRFAGVDVATAATRIETALDAGMTLIDTADVYGLDNDCPWGSAETLLGEVLAANPSLRSRMVLATKGGIQLDRGIGMGVPYDTSARRINEACDDSLKRLQTDVIDLWQIHRPDLLAHPAEVGAAMQGLVDAGKVRFLGVSNYSATQIAALQAHLKSPLITTQPEYSVAQLSPIDDGVFDHAMTHGITPLAWSPLAGGRLVDTTNTEPRFVAMRALLAELAETHNATPTQIALAFVLAHPAGIIPIIGTGKPERIVESAGAASIVLAKDDCYRLIAASGRALP
jgi:aryl-alcohol dehydrogenase-like predicted oxidoreductase